jgi:recombination associated protein RdgC
MFKNAYIYRLTQPFTIGPEKLQEMLESQAFVPCSGIRPSSFGWIPPLAGYEGQLFHTVAGNYLMCARREEKVVPRSALMEHVEERIAKIEATEGRKLPAKDRASLKDDSLAHLLPQALARSKQVLGYLAIDDGLLIIATATSSEAEMFIDCLRTSLGSLSVVIPRVQGKPTDTFTHWLTHREIPDGFGLGDQCDLVDPEDGSSVTCRRQDLATQEIRSHVEAGKICSRLGLDWHGDVTFAVDKDLSLKQIRFNVTDDANFEGDGDAEVAQLDAAFVNMALEFKRMLPALFAALGGEIPPDT